MPDPMPLRGRLVLDISQGAAGPSCGMALAEHGARVIKVEPPQGDWMRPLGAGVEGSSAFALYYNRGKESMVLDLKSEKGRAAAFEIAARADLLIESGRPGVTESLGLGFEAVRARNPSVIYLTISGFGLEGPRSQDPMTDTFAQAFTGWMSINRDAEETPVKFGQPMIDAITGLYAAQAALAALFPTDGPREARRLDISLAQAAAAIMGPKVMEWALTGGAPAALNAPAGVYRARDRHLAFTLVREAHWHALCRALDRPDWAGDPRFATFPDRAANLDTLRDLLSERLAERDADDWCAALNAEGVMAGPINDFGDWLADAQTRASEAAPDIFYAGTSLPTPRTPSRGPFAAPSPRPGADTERIAHEFGLDLEEN
ncbi:MAG: CaiB/BaiF CoA transferase family protein [Pseudomonadota bacterium]